MDCIFCKIVEGALPCHKIHENERALVFLDINPGCEGHSLIIPKNHAKDFFDLEPEDLAAVMAAARAAAPALMAVTGAEGMNLHQSNGAAAGQEVFHFHLHLLPRRGEDGLRGPWRPGATDHEALAELATKLKAALDAGP